MENLNDPVILVVSCDAYADAWPAFFHHFFYHWPNCPYPIYLQTNYLKPSFPGVNIVAVGKDQDWSTNLITALHQISAEKILLLLEDFWLWQPVKTDFIKTLIDQMEKTHAGYLRLVPKPPGDEMFSDYSKLGYIYKGAHYRVSFQAGVWNKALLSKILLPGESAWQAEIEGSKRSDHLSENFVSVMRMPAEEWPICYLNAIIKRKWTPEAVNLAKQRQITLDYTKRSVCNRYDQLRRKKIFRYTVNYLAIFFQKILPVSYYKKIKTMPLLRKLIY